MKEKSLKYQLWYIVLSINFVIALLWFKSFVLMKCWEWFVVDLFNVPALTIWNSLGLICVVGILQKKDFKEDEERTISKLCILFLQLFCAYGLFLTIGYFVK